MNQNAKSFSVAACLFFTLAAVAAVGEQSKQEGIYERLWNVPRIYEDEENSIIQRFSIVGRYHGQYWKVNSNEGSADGWENRRIYLGAEAGLFQQLTVHGQIVISEDLDPFYEELYQAYVEWSPGPAISLRAGRLDFLFTGLERTVSSTRILTFERGLLVNQLMPGEVVGALAGGKHGHFSYRAGIFSGSIEDEFTHFDGGVGAVAGVGYDLPLFYESGRVYLDYLFNDGDSQNNAFKRYDHVVSLWHQGQKGPFGLGLDLTFGHGLDARPLVFGLTILPTYEIAKDVLRKGDAVQAVLRYQFSVSEGDNGLQLQKRYEREASSGPSGDSYHAFYGGINYRLFGDRLKLMTGVEYSTMDDAANDGGDYKGWTGFAGVRLFF